MILRSLAILFLLLPADVSIRLKQLGDGRTEVPARADYFTKKYRENYPVEPPAGVQCNVLYTEVYYISGNGNKLELQERTSQDYSRHLLFYENGCVNKFYLQRKNGVNLDPEYSGYRGMCYVKKGKTYLSMVSFTNDVREIRNVISEISFSGDTLFATERWSGAKYAYLKDKTYKSNYTVNW